MEGNIEDLVSRKKKLGFFAKLFMFVVLTLPITSIYVSPFPSISIGEIILAILLVVGLIVIVSNRIKITVSPFCLYLFYAVWITLLISVVFSIENFQFCFTPALKRLIRDSFYFSIIIIGQQFFDFNFGKKLINAISLFLSFYIVFQFLIFFLFGVYFPGIIPFAKTTAGGGLMGWQITEHYKMMAVDLGYARGSGFFSEPAVCAHFLTIALILQLFPIDGDIKYGKAIIFSLAMILTFSTNALVALGVCWICWILFYKNLGEKSLTVYKKQKFMRLFLLVIFILAVIVIFKNESTRMVIDRLLELKNLENNKGSAGVRIFRGPAFYMAMPLFYKIFGFGFGNFLQFKTFYNINTPYSLPVEYMNTNSYILTSTGVIGFFAYYFSLILIVKNKKIVSKILLLLLFVFSLSSSIYSSPQYIIALLFILYTPNIKKEV